MSTITDSDALEQEWTINASIVAVVLFLFALFTPLLLYVSSNVYGEIEYQIYSITWTMFAYNSAPIFSMSGGVFTGFIFLRLAFIDQMYKYYKNRVTRNRAILIGIISELQIVVVSLIPLLFSIGLPPHVSPIFLPIPLLLVIGLLFLFITPPKPARQWIEKEIAQRDLVLDPDRPSEISS